MIQPPRTAIDSERIEGDALDWFVRRTGGGFGARDEAAFQAWLQAAEAHRDAYARQRAEWTALDRLPAQGLDTLRANLAADLAGPRPIDLRRRSVVLPVCSAAGVALVAAGMGVVGWRQWQAQPVFEQRFGTRRGQQLDVPLPDGSRLRLDTATRVEVTYHRQRRDVRLAEGQAVFNVQGDPARPFVVRAGPLHVTVVGTRFLVRHTPGMARADSVRVAVEEGRVRVERAPADADGGAQTGALLLAAGQQVACDAQGVPGAVGAVPSAGIAPWRDNRVSFDDARLDHVLAELERYGNTRLVLRDPSAAGLRITGTFNPARPEGFARMLLHAAPVRLREANGVTEIVRSD